MLNFTIYTRIYDVLICCSLLVLCVWCREALCCSSGVVAVELFEACLTADMGLVKELSSKMDAQAVKAAVNRMPSGNSSLLHR